MTASSSNLWQAALLILLLSALVACSSTPPSSPPVEPVSTPAPVQPQGPPPRTIVCTWDGPTKSCGVVDENGAIVIDFEALPGRTLYGFKDGYAVVRLDHDGEVREMLIDSDGKTVIEPLYATVGLPSEGLVAVREVDGLCGYADTTGTMVLEPQWPSCESFSEGRARVLTTVEGFEKRYGYIDTSGQWVVPQQYEDAHDFHDGRARVCVDLYCGYLDLDGKPITELEFFYGDADDFFNGMAVVGDSESADTVHYGALDKAGKLVWPMTFATRHRFTPEGLAVAGPYDENRLYSNHPPRASPVGYIRTDGTWAIEPDLIEGDDFSEGLAFVETKEGWRGYIDVHGAQVLAADYGFPFSQGLARMVLDSDCGSPCGCWTFADRHGKAAFPFVIANGFFNPFDENGIARVEIEPYNEVYSEVLLHKERGIIWPPEWNEPGVGEPNVVCWPELKKNNPNLESLDDSDKPTKAPDKPQEAATPQKTPSISALIGTWMNPLRLIALNPDGSFVTFGDDLMFSAGTYESQGNTLTLTGVDGSQATFTTRLEGDSLELTAPDGFSITLQREDSLTPTPPTQ